MAPNPYRYNDPADDWGAFQGPGPVAGFIQVGLRNALDPWRVDPAASAVSNPLDLYGISGPKPAPVILGFMDPMDVHARFLDRHYGPAARALAPYDVDPALPLGLAAHESGWGTSRRDREDNNPFGYVPPGPPVKFASPDAAWQAWANEFGSRVQGVGGDFEKFIANLAVDQRRLNGPPIGGRYTGAYNSESKKWAPGATGRIQDVRDRLPRWLGYYDAMP
jgi:hypothetical protein